MLAVRDLSIRRGECPVVDAVSLVLAPGSVTAILGPNGAGKSTLLLGMAGLIAPASGTVMLDDVPLCAMAARARARIIGLLPQEPELYWGLEVGALVALGRLPHRGVRGPVMADDRQAIADAIGFADIGHLVGRRADRLSGGERARVLAARMIAGQPRVILADEPLANLDPRHQQDMLRLFRRLADGGAAVALVLHDLSAAARIADQAMLMAAGRAVAHGAAADILVPARLEALFDVAVARVETPDGPALLSGGRLR